jgi:AcrR family transcriptional regulator
VATAAERTRLSRETVVDGALALADAEGLEGLTIRQLAKRLGVTPMALYWHFDNKDELLRGMVDRLWSLVDTDIDPALPWPARLRALMNSVVEVLHTHRSVASQAMFTDSGTTTEACRITESAFVILADAGFPISEAAKICCHGVRTAMTLAVGDPGFRPTQTPDEAAEHMRRKRLALQALPPDRFPHLIEAADALTAAQAPGASLEFGIEMFVAGVETMAARRRSADT